MPGYADGRHARSRQSVRHDVERRRPTRSRCDWLALGTTGGMPWDAGSERSPSSVSACRLPCLCGRWSMRCSARGTRSSERRRVRTRRRERLPAGRWTARPADSPRVLRRGPTPLVNRLHSGSLRPAGVAARCVRPSNALARWCPRRRRSPATSPRRSTRRAAGRASVAGGRAVPAPGDWTVSFRYAAVSSSM